MVQKGTVRNEHREMYRAGITEGIPPEILELIKADEEAVKAQQQAEQPKVKKEAKDK